MRFALLLLLIPTVAFADAYPPPKGARNLCSEHVIGNTMHIAWTSWASKDDVAKVVADYEKSLAMKAKAGDKGEHEFSDGKNLRLAIYPAAKVDDFPHCATKPAAGEKTIVLISQAIR
jgi:hypothetical protein